MNENVKMSACSQPGLVQQPRPLHSQTRDRSAKVRNRKSDVMKSLAALFDKLRNHGIGPGSFEQLDAGTANRQHRHVHFFLFDGLAQCHGEAQLFLVEFERAVDGAHRNAQVINFESV